MREIERNYSIRKSDYLSRYSSRYGKRGVKRIDKKTIEKIINQFIVSAVIALVIIIISNIKTPFITDFIKNVKWVAHEDYDFKGQFSVFFQKTIPGLTENVKKIPDSILGKNSSVNTSSDNMMIIPVDGEITSAFGIRNNPVEPGSSEMHGGIDIAASDGTPIKAAMGGTVENVGEDKSLGRMVKIKHDGGLETVYGHCSEILVNKGQSVKQGDIIAKVGHTGNVTGPHVHFEVIKDGTKIDPLNEIRNTAELK
ncbi:MAG: M23 family metallopeptidase [Clostridiales bacterium]|mgnify:CR=1 FL=1|nr:M23 family metallopeptidase [Clostridiales bacterium]HBM80561.1 histidine phosphatase family protein [Clostridiaceae bacterium]